MNEHIQYSTVQYSTVGIVPLHSYSVGIVPLHSYSVGIVPLHSYSGAALLMSIKVHCDKPEVKCVWLSEMCLG